METLRCVLHCLSLLCHCPVEKRGGTRETMHAPLGPGHLVIPLVARDLDPGFWGWRHGFTVERDKISIWRRSITLVVDGVLESAALQCDSKKRDMLLQSACFGASWQHGGMLVLTKVEEDLYVAHTVREGSDKYDRFLAACDLVVPRSPEIRFGYC